jgi:hypothetical protein
MGTFNQHSVVAKRTKASFKDLSRGKGRRFKSRHNQGDLDQLRFVCPDNATLNKCDLFDLPY